MLGRVPENTFSSGFWGSEERRRRSLEATQGMAKAVAWIQRGEGMKITDGKRLAAKAR